MTTNKKYLTHVYDVILAIQDLNKMKCRVWQKCSDIISGQSHRPGGSTEADPKYQHADSFLTFEIGTKCATMFVRFHPSV